MKKNKLNYANKHRINTPNYRAVLNVQPSEEASRCGKAHPRRPPINAKYLFNATKANRGSRGRALIILKLGARRRTQTSLALAGNRTPVSVARSMGSLH